jgi:hypothetical protein
VEQVRELLHTEDPGDVVEQVRHLLTQVDEQSRAQWSDDDTLLLVYLQKALAAAGRKGYSLREVRIILEGLRPPGMEQ